jgi:hypothetical protein
MGARLTSFKVDALVDPFGGVSAWPWAGCYARRPVRKVDWQQHLVQRAGAGRATCTAASDRLAGGPALIQTLVQRTSFCAE